MQNHTYEEILQETSYLKKLVDEKLSEINYSVGWEYVSWLQKQTIYFYEGYKKLGYNTQPDDLMRGDVIWAEFGINIGTELSDYRTKGHYCVCWAIDLGNVVVIPLSSSDAPGSILTYDLGEIEGLGYNGSHSYLKLDAIRSISKRRISRIPNTLSGKIRLKDEQIAIINDAIKNSFVS
ncbi:MAG TPA: hypothetical protein DCY93_03605 [Firmicutes bacterium]|nr:hypothetical protein [Bacillota bacterium]